MIQPYSMIVVHDQSKDIGEYKAIAEQLGLRLVQLNPILQPTALEYMLERENPQAIVVLADSFPDDIEMLLQGQFTDVNNRKLKPMCSLYPTIDVPCRVTDYYDGQSPFPVIYQSSREYAFIRKQAAMGLMYTHVPLYTWALDIIPSAEEIEEIMHICGISRQLKEQVCLSEARNNVIKVNFCKNP